MNTAEGDVDLARVVCNEMASQYAKGGLQKDDLLALRVKLLREAFSAKGPGEAEDPADDKGDEDNQGPESDPEEGDEEGDPETDDDPDAHDAD